MCHVILLLLLLLLRLCSDRLRRIFHRIFRNVLIKMSGIGKLIPINVTFFPVSHHFRHQTTPHEHKHTQVQLPPKHPPTEWQHGIIWVTFVRLLLCSHRQAELAATMFFLIVLKWNEPRQPDIGFEILISWIFDSWSERRVVGVAICTNFRSYFCWHKFTTWPLQQQQQPSGTTPKIPFGFGERVRVLQWHSFCLFNFLGVLHCWLANAFTFTGR